MQLTFGDAEDLGQRKRTRREVFLAEMDQVEPPRESRRLVGVSHAAMASSRCC